MASRREFLKLFPAGAFLAATWKLQRGLPYSSSRVFSPGPGRRQVAIPGGSLDPTLIPKYETQLVIPPAMPQTVVAGLPAGLSYYEIAVRQFTQHILPQSMELAQTTVWSYGSVNQPDTFNYPAFTIEAAYEQPVRVKWINGLMDPNGNYLPHLLPVDPSLHWANPPGGRPGRDSEPAFTVTPGPYIGPVPIVTHLHGAHSFPESDGFPEAWYLPAANNIPGGYAGAGSFYNYFREEFRKKSDILWEPGTAVFQYQNDQPATTLWYHDHTLGITRQNVYAGPAGFYLLRGGPEDLAAGVLPGPAPTVGSDPFGIFYEIPLVIQDRSFNDDGSLFYPDSREFFDTFTGPYIPDSDVPPIWNPEFFGNTMVVNGRTWPYLTVEQRRYRFRILNGCNSRFLILDFNEIQSVEVWQIGNDGGFLAAPVNITADHGNRLLMAPAERADVIIDFTNVPVGQHIITNVGPDEPFGGGEPGVSFPVADPGTTGQVMELRVVVATGTDPSQDPASLTLPGLPPLGPETNTRQVSLNEEESTFTGFTGPVAALLGTVTGLGIGVPMDWGDAVSENPAHNSIEIWEIFNFTEDAHPIHIHDVQFEVINRQLTAGGPARPPEPWETGRKDTVISFPDEITRVKAHFDNPGLFVWHCHILEHEDNVMMRPFFIGDIAGLPIPTEIFLPWIDR